MKNGCPPHRKEPPLEAEDPEEPLTLISILSDIIVDTLISDG